MEGTGQSVTINPTVGIIFRRSRDRERDRGERGARGRRDAHVLGVRGRVDLPERFGAALERLGIERGRDGLRLVLRASRGGHGGGGSGTRGARAHGHMGTKALNGGPEHDSRPVRERSSSRRKESGWLEALEASGFCVPSSDRRSRSCSQARVRYFGHNWASSRRPIVRWKHIRKGHINTAYFDLSFVYIQVMISCVPKPYYTGKSSQNSNFSGKPIFTVISARLRVRAASASQRVAAVSAAHETRRHPRRSPVHLISGVAAARFA